MTRRLVLASASPRRKFLLQEAGFDVVCIVSGAEEIEDPSLPPAALALENAARKARAVANRFPRETVIAADTVVWMDGRFFGKPADRDDALRMLMELAGRVHEVVTGVVISGPGASAREFAESSLVRFHPLGAPALIEYLDSIQPLDKAGAYAAQDDRGRIIRSIEGSLTNVIGLPMERLLEALDALPHAHKKSPGG